MRIQNYGLDFLTDTVDLILGLLVSKSSLYMKFNPAFTLWHAIKKTQKCIRVYCRSVRDHIDS